MATSSIASRVAAWAFVGASLVLLLAATVLVHQVSAAEVRVLQLEAAAIVRSDALRLRSSLETIGAASNLLAQEATFHPGERQALADAILTTLPAIRGIALVAPDSADASARSTSLKEVSAGTLVGPVGVPAHCSPSCWTSVASVTKAPPSLRYVSLHPPTNMYVVADLDSTFLSKILSAEARPPDTLSYVLDGQDRFIAHDEPDRIGEKADYPLLTPNYASAEMRTVTESLTFFPDVPRTWHFIERVDGTPWSLGQEVSNDRVMAVNRDILVRNAIVAIVALCVLALLLRSLCRRLLRPLMDLTDGCARAAKGNFALAFPIATLLRRDEVGLLASSFVHMQDEISSQLRVIAKSAKADERRVNELAVTRQIQCGLMPAPTFVDSDGSVVVRASLIQSSTCSNGFYTYIVLADTTWLITGNVIGTGLSTSIQTAHVATFVRLRAPACQSPDQLLADLNEELLRPHCPSSSVAMVCVAVDHGTGTYKVACAGHDAPLVCNDGGPYRINVNPGPLLGLSRHTTFPVVRRSLSVNDILSIVSRGAVNCTGEQGRAFDDHFCISTMKRTALHDPSTLIEGLLAGIHAHQRGIPYPDNIALLAFQWHGPLPHQSLHRTIRADLDTIIAAVADIASLLWGLGADDDTKNDVCLCAEELMMNIFVHGKEDGRVATLTFTVRLVAEDVILIISDDGPEFDPTSVVYTELSDLVSPGGVYLVRSIAKEMSYVRKLETNQLTSRYRFVQRYGN